ncbi:T7SS effector LXG polymorphic toxin [Rummeliibacillus pycnus]|uniref:T7SS effector LXG polymorphic toxin n=1 Tax=Rummeliibacillus pycnus TaxID=101070 RepID=UPI0037CACEB7
MRWIDITKILDVTGLQNGIKDTLKSLKNKQTEIKEVEKAVQGIIALEDAFKGKSGDALRDFYKEVHIPFMSYYQDFIEDYKSKLDIMDKELLALESASDGRIVEEFLTGELKNSLQKTANHTITLTDDTNDTILSVQDIVALPQLSDASFLEEVNDAKKQINDTVEKVHQFDYNQTEALEQLSKDVSNMQNYINGIKSLSNSGKLQLENYASGTLNKYHLDDWLTDVGSTCPRADTEEVDKIEELKEKLLKASSVDEYLKIAEELGDANLDEDQKQFITMLKTAKGIKDGLYESGKDFVVGICNGIYDLFTTNPIETVESTLKALKAVADPETYKYLAKSIADSYERDVINGDAESRARWISYASVTVLTSVVGTKGAGAVTKAGMATTKAAAKAGVSTVKGALKETSITNLLPYAPQHQLAGVNVGGVPFNTVDSAGLRDRLLSVAKGSVEDFNPKTATNKQKGNYGEIKSSDNLLNNKSLKGAGYDLKPVGKGAPSSIDDKIVKGIDGLYENKHPDSNIKYVIDEAKFGSSQLGKTKDGPQMSDKWLRGSISGKSRILKAVDGDKKLATKITNALNEDEVERVLSKVDSRGNVKTFRLDADGNIIGEWP